MTPESIKARLEKNSIPEPNSGCVLWTAGDLGNGYGVLGIGGRLTLAHRASYEAHMGPIPAGMLVCHKCDVKCCINPNHLFLGTVQDNTDDMVRKGRHVRCGVRGAGNKNAKLSNEQVMAIRAATERTGLVALAHGVSGNTARRIRNGRGWRHL